MKIIKFNLDSRASFSLLIVLLFILISCATEQKEWEKAKKDNTPEGYELFISKYPKSEFSQQAINAKNKLKEEILWEEAIKKKTAVGYEMYLSEYPDGEFSQQAHDAKIELEEEILWEDAINKNTVEGYSLYLSKYPEGKYSEQVISAKIKLEEEKLWEDTQRKNTVEGYNYFLSEYPESKYAQQAINAKGKLAPNIVFNKINKSKTKTSYGVYREPTNVIATDGTLLAEFVCHQSTWITGLNVYFYVMNKGGSGTVSIKCTYSDDLGTKIEKVKKIKLLKSKEYICKVIIDFKSNVAVTTPNAKRINNLVITLPNGTKDNFSASITSWQGTIADIEFIEIK